MDVNCLIERQESEVNYEGFGFDRSQQVEYRFNRHTLEEKTLYPEIGDVIFHNNGYFEIDNVREDFMLAGRTESKFSIICSTFMMRRSQLNIEEKDRIMKEPFKGSSKKNRLKKFHFLEVKSFQ